MVKQLGGVWLVGPVIGLLVEADADRTDLERAEGLLAAGRTLRESGFSLVLLPAGFELSQSRRRWWSR